MNWILIYVVSQMIGAAGFDTQEACLGRVSVLKEQKIDARCVEAPDVPGTTLYVPDGIYLNAGLVFN